MDAAQILGSDTAKLGQLYPVTFRLKSAAMGTRQFGLLNVVQHQATQIKRLEAAVRLLQDAHHQD